MDALIVTIETFLAAALRQAAPLTLAGIGVAYAEKAGILNIGEEGIMLGGAFGGFIGMLTDSRSFLSYARHEYFRRTLCNLIGNDVEAGLLPASELDFIGQMVENISYNNARDFFKF